MSIEYDFKKIEEKWQKKWKEKGLFDANLTSSEKIPFYNLAMFPYPSGASLHAGHAFTYSGIDAIGRFKRHLGYNVFQPFGFDAFGIHGENYAIKVNRHPSDVLEENVKIFKKQVERLGLIFDWTHSVNTTYPEYYKWTQWIFIQLYKKGLAVRKKSEVNWCSSCKTVLADEQVIQGKCERCSTITEKREMLQWFFKISEYAQKLLDNHDKIDWSKKTILAQKNWIGRSEGAIVKFPVLNIENVSIDVFTTRIDTLFGATFITVSSKHPILNKIPEKYIEEVEKTIKIIESKTELDMQKEKIGTFTGLYAINPINKEEIPIYIANYVVSTYGTGALMGVPAHDSRDFDFATKLKIPIKQVIFTNNTKLPIESEGVLKNSGKYTGLNSEIARDTILNDLIKEKVAQFKVTYKLRDWLVSRQRYWGPPIPIVYCNSCGIVPVEDLPVFLPYLEDFKPKGTGNSPLASSEAFVNTTCPNCKGKAKRETDVLDNFVDSSWYFLRYPSSNFDNVAFDKDLTKKWLPVDMYTGGNEHAVLHLMYTRFIIMFLHDNGYLDFDEPFKKFRAHGLIIKDGMKMSKSKGNIINPEEYIDKYGADVFRLYILFIGPFTEGGNFSDKNIKGIVRFIYKIFEIKNLKTDLKRTSIDTTYIENLIVKITESVDNLKFNLSIANLMEYLNWIYKHHNLLSQNDLRKFIKSFIVMLSIYAPYITEEIWEMLGYKDELTDYIWPKIKNIKSSLMVKYAIQINGKLRGLIEIPVDSSEDLVVNKIMEDEKLGKFVINGYKKSIFIKNKIINFIV